MRTIDANSGQELREGMTFRNVHGVMTVLKIRPGIFSASARLRMVEPNRTALDLLTGRPVPTSVLTEPGEEIEVPLAVRWTHPAFFGRRVAFLPS